MRPPGLFAAIELCSAFALGLHHPSPCCKVCSILSDAQVILKFLSDKCSEDNGEEYRRRLPERWFSGAFGPFRSLVREIPTRY